jgi:Mg-chelatase subunit ChlD
MRRRTLREDDRGISELIGTALLIGLVFAGALVTLAVGTQAVDQVTSQQQSAAATEVIEEVDAALTSVAATSGANRTTLDFSGENARNIRVVRRGAVNFTVNSNPSCTAEVPLSSIRFEQSGNTLAFEAGGLWRAARSNGSSLVSKPNFAYRNGTLSANLFNVTGTVDRDVNVANYRRAESLRRTNEVAVELLSAPCQTPNNITVDVQSDFYQAWADYFEADFAVGSVSTFHGNDTARLFVPDSDFPKRLDNERNAVINLSQSPTAPYMDDVDVDGGDASIAAEKVDVTGGAGGPGPFVAALRPLDRGSPPKIGQVKELTTANTTNFTRPPVDVVFVMDESGSMSGSKTANAKDAAQKAVGTMNTSVVGDRGGLVGYTTTGRYLFPDDRYLTNDSAELNDSIDDFSASGSTDIADGLNRSIALLSTARDVRNDASILLLTDGNNSPGSECNYYGYSYSSSACKSYYDERTRNAAEIAAKRGYTVYTFGYGSGADEDLLKEVANTTGGEYYFAADGDELEAAFENVVGDITDGQKYLTRTPLSTNTTTGDGQVHTPQIPGSVDDIGVFTENGNTFLNVNDPTAPSLFSHAFSVENGESVRFNASTYRCDAWEGTGSFQERNSVNYPVARCANVTTTNTSLDSSHITFHSNFTNSDVSDLLQNDEVNETLEPFVDSNDQVTTRSNRVIVRFDFRPQDTGGTTDVRNDLFMLYQVGLSESSVDTDQLLSITVNRIDFED